MNLDSYLPAYLIREVHYAAVHSPPRETYETFCSFDMARIPWIKGLFQLRTIFEKSEPSEFHLTLRDAYAHGGFVRLYETPNEELIAGAIGKIWRPVIPFEKIQPDSFADFHLPGFGKVIWSLQCKPRIEGGTLIRFELRVGATDTLSTAKMRAYYSVVGPFSRTIREATLRRISDKLGDVFAEEQSRNLPGDEIIENTAGSATHGITIEAPPEAIWPWLVQMGEERAGWYSYDWLDHSGIPSAKRILSDFQNPKEGELLRAGPNPEGGFFVLRMEAPHSLVLGTCTDMDSGKAYRPDVPVQPSHYLCTTWAFHLQPQTEDITRLIVRARLDYSESGTWKGHFRTLFMERFHAFMERKQLENIKIRAENFGVAA